MRRRNRQRSASTRPPHCTHSRSTEQAWSLPQFTSDIEREFRGIKPLDDEAKVNMGTKAMEGVLVVRRALQRAGPYVLIEVVLPGGTLIALLLFAYRQGPAKLRADLNRVGEVVLRSIRDSVGRLGDALGVRYIAAVSGGRQERDGLEPLGIALD